MLIVMFLPTFLNILLIKSEGLDTKHIKKFQTNVTKLFLENNTRQFEYKVNNDQMYFRHNNTYQRIRDVKRNRRKCTNNFNHVDEYSLYRVRDLKKSVFLMEPENQILSKKYLVFSLDNDSATSLEEYTKIPSITLLLENNRCLVKNKIEDHCKAQKSYEKAMRVLWDQRKFYKSTNFLSKIRSFLTMRQSKRECSYKNWPLDISRENYHRNSKPWIFKFVNNSKSLKHNLIKPSTTTKPTTEIYKHKKEINVQILNEDGIPSPMIDTAVTEYIKESELGLNVNVYNVINNFVDMPKRHKVKRTPRMTFNFKSTEPPGKCKNKSEKNKRLAYFFDVTKTKTAYRLGPIYRIDRNTFLFLHLNDKHIKAYEDSNQQLGPDSEIIFQNNVLDVVVSLGPSTHDKDKCKQKTKCKPKKRKKIIPKCSSDKEKTKSFEKQIQQVSFKVNGNLRYLNIINFINIRRNGTDVKTYFGPGFENMDNSTIFKLLDSETPLLE